MESGAIRFSHNLGAAAAAAAKRGSQERGTHLRELELVRKLCNNGSNGGCVRVGDGAAARVAHGAR